MPALVSVRGADKVARRIRTIRMGIGVVLASDAPANLVLKRTLDRFDKEVDPNNIKWAPLKPSTLLLKKRIGAPNKILKRSLKLRQSIKIIRGAVGSGFGTATGTGRRIGVTDPSLVPRARAHQFGTSRMVKRRFLGVGPLDVKAVDSLLRREIARVIKS